jgi:hypothetical protein
MNTLAAPSWKPSMASHISHRLAPTMTCAIGTSIAATDASPTAVIRQGRTAITASGDKLAAGQGLDPQVT